MRVLTTRADVRPHEVRQLVSLLARARAHPLRHAAAFHRLFAGDVLVTVAERYFILAFTWWLLSSAGGKGRLALLLAMESIPVLAVGLLAGPFIDRWPKRTTLVWSVVAQAVVLGVVFGLLCGDALAFSRLCVGGFALGCLIPIFGTAINAALPQSVPADCLLAATALMSSTLEFANVIAAGLASTLLAIFGIEVAVAVNVALYVVGGLFLLGLPLETPTRGAVESKGYWRELGAGLRALTANRPLLVFVVIHAATLIFLVPLLVIIPMLVQSVLGGDVGWLGALETTFSLGAIVTALALSVRTRHRDLYVLFTCGMTCLAGLMVVLARASNPYAMLPIVFAMGASVALVLAASSMVFQLVVPDDVKGRVFGTLETLAAATTPAGYALVGLTAGGPSEILLASAAGMLLLGLAALFAPRAHAQLT